MLQQRCPVPSGDTHAARSAQRRSPASQSPAVRACQRGARQTEQCAGGREFLQNVVAEEGPHHYHARRGYRGPVAVPDPSPEQCERKRGRRRAPRIPCSARCSRYMLWVDSVCVQLLVAPRPLPAMGVEKRANPARATSLAHGRAIVAPGPRTAQACRRPDHLRPPGHQIAQPKRLPEGLQRPLPRPGQTLVRVAPLEWV